MLSVCAGGARFGGVTLRSRQTDTTPSKKPTDEPQNEFFNLKLRQTSRDGGGRGRKTEAEPKVDFGVKLKSTVSYNYPLGNGLVSTTGQFLGSPVSHICDSCPHSDIERRVHM